jgi:integral membrane protein
MMTLLTTSLGRLRIIGFLEGLSFLFLLLIAMPVKYMAGEPILVKVTGMIHGVLFVAYVLKVIIVKIELDWSVKKSLLAFVASLIPFGTFYADSKLFRE